MNNELIESQRNELDESQLLAAINAGGDQTDALASFSKITIPLVKRIYPQLMASQIVSVQPMVSPNYELVKPTTISKNKKPKIWRDIDESWEPSSE